MDTVIVIFLRIGSVRSVAGSSMITSTTSTASTMRIRSTDTTFTITAIGQAELKCTATNDTSFSSAEVLHEGEPLTPIRSFGGYGKV